VPELVQLDREVSRAWASYQRWRGELDAGDADRTPPLDAVRHVAGRQAYLSLVEPDASALSAADRPLREGLSRWVVALLRARLAQPNDAEFARLAGVAAPHPFDLQPNPASYRDAHRALLHARSAPVAQSWLAVARERAPALVAALAQRRERDAEVMYRLDLHDGPQFEDGVSKSALTSLARDFLARTDDLWASVSREAHRRHFDGDLGPASVLLLARGHDAPEGWPARSPSAWVGSEFAVYARGAPVVSLGPSEAVGASSFMRALEHFGVALRVAWGRRSSPFAVGVDPWFADAYRIGGVFAALGASVPFQRRRLGNSRRVADAQARVLSRVALFELRARAFVALVAHEPSIEAELGARLFCRPLPEPLGALLPRPVADPGARFLGALATVESFDDLVSRFDEDWFENPAAVEQVQRICSAPARLPPAEMAAALALDRARGESMASATVAVGGEDALRRSLRTTVARFEGALG